MATESTEEGGGDVGEEFDANIGLVGAMAIGIGTMMAAGIFVLSGLAVSNVGTVAIISFLIAAFIASITAGAYAEFASIYQESGGGYMYVDKTFDTDLTYIMGWTMILGYPASAAFYLASFSDWFAEFIYPLFNVPSVVPYWLPGMGILALLVGLNVKGTEESSQFQIAVTTIKVVLVALFIYGGLQTFDAQVVTTSFAQHITDFGQIGVTAALVFITFFGFSAVATNAEETKNPAYTIPRAIYYSIGFVIFVYALVVLVIVLAINSSQFKQFLAAQSHEIASAAAAPEFIATHGEVAMAYAAQYYLGNIGFYVIIVGALFSMLSAANATILAGSRVKLALARRGHLPSGFEDLSEAGTPYKSIFLTGGFIFIYLVVFTILFGKAPYSLPALELGIEGVTQFANALLISGLTVVNGALIASRRRSPDIDRGFEMPLVPWIPAIGILANIVMLYFVGLTAVTLALIGEAVGIVVWFAFISGKTEREIEAETPTAVTEQYPHEHDYQLLVPIANRESVDQLMRTAIDLVNDRDGEIHVLNVVQTPRQTPFSERRRTANEQHRELVREAMDIAEEAGVPVSGTVRYAHDPEDAILNSAEQYGSEGILMGWGGHRSHRRDIVIGSTVDDVVTESDADVYVEKIGAGEGRVESILLPTAGGPHTELAAETARTIAQTTGAAVHAVRVVTPGEGSVEDARAQLEKITETFEGSGVDVETRIIEHDDVVEALVEEADDHDLTIIGATREGALQQLVFGAIPEAVGDGVRNTAIMVRQNVSAGSRIRRWLGAD